MTRLGLGVVNVFHRQVQLVCMAFHLATVLSTPVGQNP
jgi:hypothetical protein